jgi:hypothetical protein
MALIVCDECGREISSKALACIHCGNPLDGNDSFSPAQDSNPPMVSNTDEDTYCEGIIAKVADDKDDLPWKYKIRDIEGINYFANGDVVVISANTDINLIDGQIVLFDPSLANGRVSRIKISDDLYYVSKEDFSKDTGVVLTQVRNSNNINSPKVQNNDKITKNYLWILMVVILCGGYWISKGTPSINLLFASSAAKSECERLAIKNKGNGIIGEGAVMADATWLKDGKRVVRLKQIEEDEINTIMCLYSNGIVQIPGLFEQGRWR